MTTGTDRRISSHRCRYAQKLAHLVSPQVTTESASQIRDFLYVEAGGESGEYGSSGVGVET